MLQPIECAREANRTCLTNNLENSREMSSDYLPTSLTDLIEQVQLALPEFITITICADEEPFHLQLGGCFFPLEYADPKLKIDKIISILGESIQYETGTCSFPRARAIRDGESLQLSTTALHEILSNLGDAPVVLFITKREWYVDVLDTGPFYPIPNVAAADFIDCIYDNWRDNAD